MSKKNLEKIAAEREQLIINKAKQFYRENKTIKEIEKTFGYFTNHIISPLNQMRLKYILYTLLKEKEKRNKQLKVLDIGSGGGIISTAISSVGFTCLGIDINYNEIILAEKFKNFFLKEKENCTKFLKLDIVNSPDYIWKSIIEKNLNGKPDVIVMAYTLHHLPKIDSFIKKLANWMKNGSTILINEENPLSPTFYLKHVVRTYLQNDTYCEKHKSFSQWKKLFEKYKLTVNKPIGLDIIPFLNLISPLICWSIIFTVEKHFENV